MPKGIYTRGVIIRKPHSEETRLKMSLVRIGKPLSEEHIRNMSIAKIGIKYPNRKRPVTGGLKPINKICMFCKKEFVTNCLQPRKKFCSLSCNTKSRPEMNLANLQKRDKEKQRLAVSSRVGELHQNWKGGTSKAYKTGYYSTEYKEWRKSVFERDSYKCQECGSIGFITAHHIKSFAHYPDLRFELSNGLTLCEPCHSKTDNYKGRNKNKLKSL